MKKLLVLASLLLSTFSAHAAPTVVAEDTAEHTINFTFGKPSADVYLCSVRLVAVTPDSINPDTVTFPDGSSINNASMYPGSISFTPETAPLTSVLHLKSRKYGTSLLLDYCHNLTIPGSGNPGGTVETYFKIQTPNTFDYFANANVKAYTSGSCSSFGLGNYYNEGISLSSNMVSDYTLVTSMPFGPESELSTVPQNCMTTIQIGEQAYDIDRPSSETPGQVTVGVKDVINFN